GCAAVNLSQLCHQRRASVDSVNGLQVSGQGRETQRLHILAVDPGGVKVTYKLRCTARRGVALPRHFHNDCLHLLVRLFAQYFKGAEARFVSGNLYVSQPLTIGVAVKIIAGGNMQVAGTEVDTPVPVCGRRRVSGGTGAAGTEAG